MANITYVYQYSGYDNTLEYTDIAVSGSKIAVGCSSTNTFFYLNSGTTFSSVTYSPVPLTTSATPVGVGGMFFQNNRLYFSDYDDYNYLGDISATIYWTDDFSTFSSTAIKLCNAWDYDSNTGQTYPETLNGKKPYKFNTYYTTSISFHISFSSTQVSPFYIAYITDYFTTVTSHVFYSASASGNAHSSKDTKFILYNSTTEWEHNSPATAYSNTLFYAINTTATTCIYEQVGSVTTTIPLNGLYTLTDCSYDPNDDFVVYVGKSGRVIVYDRQNSSTTYSQSQSQKDFNRIIYIGSENHIVAGKNEILKINVSNKGHLYLNSRLLFANQNNKNNPSYIFVGNSDSYSVVSKFKSYTFSTKKISSSLILGQFGYKNLFSDLYAYDLNNVVEKKLFSKCQSLSKTYKKIKSIVVSIDQPSNYFYFAFKNIRFSDLGIYITRVSDNFKKNIDIKKDYTKNGYKINRFNYYGGNVITLSGKIITDNINQIQKFLNDISHETGRLYKRAGFYTVAQLESFSINPSVTGRQFDFTMVFLAEKPYYYFDSLTSVNNELFLKTTPQAFYNTLSIINDDTSLIIKNKNVANFFSNNTTTDGFSENGDWIVSSAYLTKICKNDNFPSTNELTSTNYVSTSTLTYFDSENFSIGAVFPSIISLNKFYMKFDSSVPSQSYNDVFEIYYKDIETKEWVKYNQPFFCYIDTANKQLVFDNLFLTTYEFKLHSIKNINKLGFYNSNNTLIIPRYFNKFYFINKKDINSTYEYVWDIKNNIFYLDMNKTDYQGDMLKIYPKITYLWCNKSIEVILKYKFNDLYFAL